MACDSKWGIGKSGKMPWRFPADFAHFKKTTMGHPMITGRKNFLDMEALPGRTTIVLTKNQDWKPTEPGVVVKYDLHEAIEHARSLGDNDEIFIVGGAQIYEAALATEMVDWIYITKITGESYACDTLFPAEYLSDFEEVSSTTTLIDGHNPRPLIFSVLQKK